jgi:hypothetical protein
MHCLVECFNPLGTSKDRIFELDMLHVGLGGVH